MGAKGSLWIQRHCRAPGRPESRVSPRAPSRPARRPSGLADGGRRLGRVPRCSLSEAHMLCSARVRFVPLLAERGLNGTAWAADRGDCLPDRSEGARVGDGLELPRLAGIALPHPAITGPGKDGLRAKPEADWLTGYYQYANRLAHLHFLRRHGIPALARLCTSRTIRTCQDRKPRGLGNKTSPRIRAFGASFFGKIPGVVNMFADCSASKRQQRS
jgi:hypothetical protein